MSSSNNIWIYPHDTIYLYREPQTFVVFGASGTQGLFNFDAWRLSLAEAMAKAVRTAGLSGLSGLRLYLSWGDPRACCAPRGQLRSLHRANRSNRIQINLRDPAGYFLTTRFQMRNKDVIFASSNPTVDAAKAMNFFRLTVAPVNDPISAALNVYALKFAIAGDPDQASLREALRHRLLRRAEAKRSPEAGNVPWLFYSASQIAGRAPCFMSWWRLHRCL